MSAHKILCLLSFFFQNWLILVEIEIRVFKENCNFSDIQRLATVIGNSLNCRFLGEIFDFMLLLALLRDASTQ